MLGNFDKHLPLRAEFATNFDMKEKSKDTYVSNERKTYDLRAAGQMIMPLVKKVLGKKGFVEIDVITNWDKIVGEELAEFVFPQKIEFKCGEKNNGTLHVCVPSGAFALEIQHREKYIVNKINTYFGYNAVNSLKIMQNSALCLNAEETEKSYQPRPPALVSPQEEKYIKELSADVENSSLQEALEKLGRSVMSHNKGVK